VDTSTSGTLIVVAIEITSGKLLPYHHFWSILSHVTRLAAAVLLAIAVAAEAGAQARTARLASPTYGGAERVVAVLLPAGYASSGRSYPVLYLLHGAGQDHSAFMARRAFVPAARRNDMIVVMPAADRVLRGADAQARYETFLATELVPYIDAEYRTAASPAGRAIAGISQGGGFAASTALRYPGIFGVVGALSAAFRGEAAGAGDPMPGTHFYVSCGTVDTLLPLSRKLVELLAARNVSHEYHEIPGGDHSWAVWDPELAAFMDVLAARGGWRASVRQ
jgi:enterochelin esterase-like enzyme